MSNITVITLNKFGKRARGCCVHVFLVHPVARREAGGVFDCDREESSNCSHDDSELKFIHNNLQVFRKEGNCCFGHIDGSDEKIDIFVEHLMSLMSIMFCMV